MANSTIKCSRSWFRCNRDQLRQTVDAVPTMYTLDQNRGITQVLAADEDAYLYGLDRIGESGSSGWAYHLPDALGSVRQLTDPEAELTASRSYEPFGDSLSSYGQGSSSYGFAGEWMDATGLVHLRARYYAPELSRFFQADPWLEVVQQLSNTGNYIYASNNPTTHVDPSGLWDFCLLWSQKGSDKYCVLGLFTLTITSVESPPFNTGLGPLIWIPWRLELSLGCEPETSILTQQITPTPKATSTPSSTSQPSSNYRTITAYRGLKGSSPSAIRNAFRIDEPIGKDWLGGLSVFETLPPGLRFKKNLPFLITYEEPKVPYETTGTVVGVLASGEQALSGGIALYAPDPAIPVYGAGHWSINIIGIPKSDFKQKLIDFGMKYFGKI